MKHIIFGTIGMMLLPGEPLIAWVIFEKLGLTQGYIASMAIIWIMSAVFRGDIYGVLIIHGWNKEGVKIEI